jgi:hypothetical protein
MDERLMSLVQLCFLTRVGLNLLEERSRKMCWAEAEQLHLN